MEEEAGGLVVEERRMGKPLMTGSDVVGQRTEVDGEGEEEEDTVELRCNNSVSLWGAPPASGGGENTFGLYGGRMTAAAQW